VAGPGDAIILNAPGQQEVFGYYDQGSTPVYPLPRQRPPDPETTLTELETILDRSDRIYAVYWATDESDPQNLVAGYLDQNAFPASHSWKGNVQLVVYAGQPDHMDLQPAGLHLGEHVVLEQFGLGRSEPDQPAWERTAGDVLAVETMWATHVPLEQDLVLFLQLLDGANHLAGQRDATLSLPGQEWQPGQTVPVRQGLLVEPGTPPGEYALIAGLYDAASGQRLATPDGQDFLRLGSLTLHPPQAALDPAALDFDHPAAAQLGPLRLLGYDRYRLGNSQEPDAALYPGDPLHLTLYWQAQSRPDQDWQLAIQFGPAGNPAQAAVNAVVPVAGVDYPTSRWQPGQIVRAQFDLFLPPDLTPGSYTVRLQLADGNGEWIDLKPVTVR
jgi:hypothetical protein